MRASTQRAFTLIELMFVLAIIALIFSMVIPAGQTIMSSNQLSHAGDQVVAILKMARQMAITTNHPMEVRFYQYGDPQAAGEDVNSPATGHYRALQVFEILDSGTASALGKCELLPTSTIFDAGSTLSSLFGTMTRIAPRTNLPRAGLNYNALAFRFLPNGSANLPKKGALWYLTLHNITDRDNLTSPPPNFITVQIDPANGGLKIWRP